MSRKQIFAVLGALILLALGVGGYFAFSGGSGSNATGAGYTIEPTDRVQGNRQAKVVLIEYAAPTCPHCAAFNEQVYPQIKRDYVDTGKVLYVFRVFPLDPADGAVEKMARCLPEDKYFPFIDLMFRNQPKWNPHMGVADVHGGLVQMGRIAGMSTEQVDQCIANTAEEERINKVASEGQSRYAITGTPTFIINGESQGTIAFDALPGLLDKALAATK